jgi:hypothetical protein
MRGLNAGSEWTHLIPGFIVAGAGTGFINPPLASTAIGVVPPQRAGMASGINSTFRQVGIATGIAGLGSVFSHKVRTDIESLLGHAPHITAPTAHKLAESVSQGSGVGGGLSKLPAAARPVAIHAVRSAFVAGLNEIFLIGAALTLVSSVLTLILIRSRDFEAGAARGPTPSAETREPPQTPAAGPGPGGEPATQPTS